MISRYAPSCIVHIACRNYINYVIVDSIHWAATRDFVPDTCGDTFTWLSHMQIVAIRVTAGGVWRPEIKTDFPKWMGAGVVIGETLSSETEINMITQGDQLYFDNLICAKYGSGLLPRCIPVVSALDHAYFNELWEPIASQITLPATYFPARHICG